MIAIRFRLQHQTLVPVFLNIRCPISHLPSFKMGVKHVLVDLLRLLVLTRLHCGRDIAVVAERETEGIQDARTGYNSAQAAQ